MLSFIKIKLPTGLYILVGSAITFIQQLKKAFYGIKENFSHNEIKLLKMGQRKTYISYIFGCWI